MTAAKLATLLVLALWPLGSGLAAEVFEAPEVIVVTGRLPGPPLWKVSNGDKVLWIFPYLTRVPRDMIWESERVARVIAQAQEVIGIPESRSGLPSSELLNPISFARGLRLRGRLVSGDDLLKKIRSLVRRNRDIKRTEISVRGYIGEDYGEWADRIKAAYASFPPEQERACFEQVVRHMEEDLNEMKSRANSWALGYIDESREVTLVFDVWDRSAVCADLYLGSSSSEQETLVDMITRRDQMWLIAAENALATNASTFAILPINELLAEDGLLSKLKAKGYDVSEP